MTEHVSDEIVEIPYKSDEIENSNVTNEIISPNLCEKNKKGKFHYNCLNIYLDIKMENSNSFKKEEPNKTKISNAKKRRK